jgi:ribosomal-protein-alanine N-acetyltransferase
MTPQQMADLHAASGPDQRPWTADEYAKALTDPNCVVSANSNGFAIGTAIMDQAELHMIIVDHKIRRSGQGQILIQAFEHACRLRGATNIILEVSIANNPAKMFYATNGYTQVGVRKQYYKTRSGGITDALVLAKSLETNDLPG